MSAIPELNLETGLPAVGYCQCGCGNKAPIVKETCKKRKQVKGQPFRFISGHQGKPRPDMSNALPFKIQGVYCRLIPLTQGQFAIVWESDYEWLSLHKWCAQWNKCTKSFYAIRKEKVNNQWREVRMHRAILGCISGEKGDHKNGVTLMNTRDNLQKADDSENAVNCRRRKDNASGVKGVFRESSKGKWRVRVQFRGKGYHGGFFDDLSLAALAHDALYKKIAGSFARDRRFQ